MCVSVFWEEILRETHRVNSQIYHLLDIPPYNRHKNDIKYINYNNIIMSPPDNCYYNDMYWADMPEVAHKAAETLGYTGETWDNDDSVPFDEKEFAACTTAEKQAAMFLHLNPIGKKFNVWWEDLDETAKEHAINIGWTSDKWDEDYEIEHLEVEQLYWADLDTKQKEAASYFGYTKATWDETWEASDFSMSASGGGGGHSVNKPHAKPTQKPNSDNGAAEGNDDGDDQKKPTKMFVPPPKGKVFGKKPEVEDKDEKKDEEHHKFGHKLVQPFKKLFNKDDE